jgi:hypothetical protein
MPKAAFGVGDYRVRQDARRPVAGRDAPMMAADFAEWPRADSTSLGSSAPQGRVVGPKSRGRGRQSSSGQIHTLRREDTRVLLERAAQAPSLDRRRVPLWCDVSTRGFGRGRHRAARAGRRAVVAAPCRTGHEARRRPRRVVVARRLAHIGRRAHDVRPRVAGSFCIAPFGGR